MSKLEKTILWIAIIIALLIAILAHVRINYNDNIIKLVAETQSYILDLLELKFKILLAGL